MKPLDIGKAKIATAPNYADLIAALDKALYLIHSRGDCSYSQIAELHEVMVRAKTWMLAEKQETDK